MKDHSFELDLIAKAEERLKVIEPEIVKLTEQLQTKVEEVPRFEAAMELEQRRVERLIKKIDTAKTSSARRELIMHEKKRPKSLRALRDDLRDSEDLVREIEGQMSDLFKEIPNLQAEIKELNRKREDAEGDIKVAKDMIDSDYDPDDPTTVRTRLDAEWKNIGQNENVAVSFKVS